MERRIVATLLKFPGTHCDGETARALTTTGFCTRTVPFSQFDARSLEKTDLAVIPGGFSYGDHGGAGFVAARKLRGTLGDELRAFRDRGGLVLGICNGFQILTELDLLPGTAWRKNTTGRFVCRWVGIEKTATDSIFLSALPDSFELPVAHGEGRLAAGETPPQQVALKYRQNPNGSAGDIAALQDDTGRVFGIMPHPERFVRREEHYDPDWSGDPQWGWGYYFFRSIARWLRERP